MTALSTFTYFTDHELFFNSWTGSRSALMMTPPESRKTKQKQCVVFAVAPGFLHHVFDPYIDLRSRQGRTPQTAQRLRESAGKQSWPNKLTLLVRFYNLGSGFARFPPLDITML